MSVGVSVNNELSVRKRFSKLNLTSPFAIVSSARKGLKPKIFFDFAAAIKMSEKNLATIINLSARTINNYNEQKKVLEPVYSEHLLKLIALYDKGEEIFRNVEEFSYWLNKPLWNSKETPMDWIITPGGVDMLMEELDKLAQGYPV
jgi:putative toxin-antitoxin system antitoxin component (TIGR02293 family)